MPALLLWFCQGWPVTDYYKDSISMCNVKADKSLHILKLKQSTMTFILDCLVFKLCVKYFSHLKPADRLWTESYSGTKIRNFIHNYRSLLWKQKNNTLSRTNTGVLRLLTTRQTNELEWGHGLIHWITFYLPKSHSTCLYTKDIFMIHTLWHMYIETGCMHTCVFL